jgi:hypothetical protein
MPKTYESIKTVADFIALLSTINPATEISWIDMAGGLSVEYEIQDNQLTLWSL